MSFLLNVFLKENKQNQRQINSFNHFVEKEIHKLVESDKTIFSDIDASFFLTYHKIRVGQPVINENMISYKITPNECRIRDLTYMAPLYVDIEYVRGREIVQRKDIVLGHLPVMLRSIPCYLSECDVDSDFQKYNECPLDPGGYFIIKGAEKVVLVQEQPSKNRIILETDKKGRLCASVTSLTRERKSRTSILFKKKKFYVHHNIFREEIPICIIMRAFGIESDGDIFLLISSAYQKSAEKNIGLEECLVPSFEEASALEIFTQKDAFSYISQRFFGQKMNENKSTETCREYVANVVLSHIPSDGFCLRGKAFYLSLMVSRILTKLLDKEECDDKDFLGNKRFELAGSLISLLFEDLFKRYNTSLKRNIDIVLKRQNRAQRFDAANLMTLQSELITTGLVRALGSGNWTLGRFRMTRSGVTEALSRLSHLSVVSMVAGRIKSQFEKTRKIQGPRSVNLSQWGRICPVDTPDGDSCGLVKNISLIAQITEDLDPAPIIKAAFLIGLHELSFSVGRNVYLSDFLVFLNGVPIGTAQNGFVQEFKLLRRKGLISPFVSISKKKDLVFISCDDGRICRPLIVVSEMKAAVQEKDILSLQENTISLKSLIENGKIEYLDSNEEDCAVIACYSKEIIEQTTHLEVCPSSILSVVSSSVPYSNHNQSPRNTYQCAMGKQAMGFVGYNQHLRFDTIIQSLVYPQKPLVNTLGAERCDYSKLPAGQNSIIAVLSYSGYDIEDAIVLNKASLERGFQRCIVTKRYLSSIRKEPQDIFLSSEECSGGIRAPGERVTDGMILANKHTPLLEEKTNSSIEKKYQKEGLIYSGIRHSYVDRVSISDIDGKIVAKLMLRQTRQPEIGDKFSSRHGQKGVCGIIVQQEDMPFSTSGVCPDIIMNPHGFPSRMTVGQLFEVVSAKKASLEGEIVDGSVFNSTVHDVCADLIKHGFSYDGNECFVSGVTGKQIPCYVFTGPVYYQKLKHMVEDKIHGRARGPRTLLTRQPTEGRGRDGGLRFGEMERDCLIGHGAMSLIVERLVISSDLFEIFVCSCGFILYREWCHECKTSDSIETVQLPYACKLLFQELLSMGILPRVVYKKS